MAAQINKERIFRPRIREEMQSDVLSYILVPGHDMYEAISSLIDEGLRVYDNPFRAPLSMVSPDQFLLGGYVLKAYSNLSITVSTMRWNAQNISAYFNTHIGRCFMWDEIIVSEPLPEIDISQFL